MRNLEYAICQPPLLIEVLNDFFYRKFDIEMCGKKKIEELRNSYQKVVKQSKDL